MANAPALEAGSSECGFKSHHQHQYRDVIQWLEGVFWVHEVAGSNPVIPTISGQRLSRQVEMGSTPSTDWFDSNSSEVAKLGIIYAAIA